MRERMVVPSVRSSEVACAEWSCVRHREDALQPLDFSNALFSVHPSQYLTERRRGQFGAARARGVPLSMSRIQPEFLDADPSSRSRAADVLVREEPEEEEEDNGKEEDGEDNEDDEGYSE